MYYSIQSGLVLKPCQTLMATKHKKGSRSETKVSFDDACQVLETILGGETRREILDYISKSKNFSKSLSRLRDGMRSNLFKAGGKQVYLDKFIKQFDDRTRQDGFHVLHDWDGKADKLNEETIPVDVVTYLLAAGTVHPEKQVLAILLDYYFLYVLALMTLRSWDGNADENADRLNRLLGDLQGPNGSGQQFTENAETLMLVATSHFEPDETAYGRLLDKVRSWSESHRVKIALAHAAILGSHLRFGLEASYGRDIVALRDDNVPDYPWLCFAAATLLQAYSRMHDEGIQGTEREQVVEGILNSLTPDPRAFVGKPPASLAASEDERSQVPQLLGKHGRDLFEECRSHRPSPDRYSPISFFFNFPHNILKGIVVHSLLHGEVSGLTMNDLLTGILRDDQLGESRTRLARTLMEYARSSPDTIRGRPTPAVIYDPSTGLRFFVKTMGVIKGQAAE